MRRNRIDRGEANRRLAMRSVRFASPAVMEGMFVWSGQAERTDEPGQQPPRLLGWASGRRMRAAKRPSVGVSGRSGVSWHGVCYTRGW